MLRITSCAVPYPGASRRRRDVPAGKRIRSSGVRPTWRQSPNGGNRGAKSWRLVSQDGGPAHFGFAVAVDPDQADVAWVVPAESDQVRVACHRRLVVCRTDDGGQTWSEFDQGLPQHNCYDFAFRHCLVLSGEDLIFGTACGSLYHSRDRGESWDTIANHLPPIYCVHVIDTE